MIRCQFRTDKHSFWRDELPNRHVPFWATPSVLWPSRATRVCVICIGYLRNIVGDIPVTLLSLQGVKAIFKTNNPPPLEKCWEFFTAPQNTWSWRRNKQPSPIHYCGIYIASPSFLLLSIILRFSYVGWRINFADIMKSLKCKPSANCACAILLIDGLGFLCLYSR